jgi:hypothetical protein
VYLAECEGTHEKGDIITVTTRHGKENECIVYNLIGEKNGKYFYSIIRADGFNSQERAKRKSDKLEKYAINAEKRSEDRRKRSEESRNFLVLGEPIKI